MLIKMNSGYFNPFNNVYNSLIWVREVTAEEYKVCNINNTV